MGRESLVRRIFLTIKFVLVYIWCLLFSDLPRVLFEKRKKIENQIVVVTGGAMGIGCEVAKILAIQEQAKVCILDINEKEGLRTVDDILNSGGHAYFFRCDVSRPDDLEKCAAEIYQDPRLGFVDICIVNAAILRFGECLDLSYSDYKLNNDVNILGHIYTVKTFLHRMVEAKQGQIVSIGSICSHYGEHYGTAYCAAKFACRGFMEALQMEIIEKGLDQIVLTSIYPYFVNTNFITNLQEPFSTFFDVISIERCSREIVDSILKERISHFIPAGIGLLCIYLKCLVTKGALPYGRKLFNFTYKPKQQEVHEITNV